MKLYEDDRYTERSFLVSNHSYIGCSVASEMTYHHFPSYNACFDLGHASLSTSTASKVFISHGHNDHCGGVVKHMWRRNSWGLPPAKYYVQKADVPLLKATIESACKMSRTRVPDDLIHAIEDEPVSIGSKLFVTAFRARHRIPCIGFLTSSHRQKLLSEFVGLPGDQIAALKRSGTVITQEILFPEIAYTGDTSVQIFDDYPDLLNARVLITECTGLEESMDPKDVYKAGHIHIDHLCKLFAERDFTGEHLILGHFSARYDRRTCINLVRSRLPAHILEKTTII